MGARPARKSGPRPKSSQSAFDVCRRAVEGRRASRGCGGRGVTTRAVRACGATAAPSDYPPPCLASLGDHTWPFLHLRRTTCTGRGCATGFPSVSVTSREPHSGQGSGLGSGGFGGLGFMAEDLQPPRRAVETGSGGSDVLGQRRASSARPCPGNPTKAEAPAPGRTGYQGLLLSRRRSLLTGRSEPSPPRTCLARPLARASRCRTKISGYPLRRPVAQCSSRRCPCRAAQRKRCRA
jgi:hypothetical protein